MKELAAALSKAQAQIDGAKKDSANPHFKSKYADLASVWDACRKALTDHGLSIVQFGRVTETGEWVLVTQLLHASGEFVEGWVPLLNGKGDMQGLGSAITYARRYGLAAMVGVSPEDDDGHAASVKVEAKAAPAAAPAGYDNWRADFVASADNGFQAFGEAWLGTTEQNRLYFTATEPGKGAELKARAQAADAKATTA